MVWQQALYLVNLLCKFVPCEYNFPYPDTSLSEPQAFKDLISIGYDEKDKDNPAGSLKIGGDGWGWNQVEPEIEYTDNDPLVVITKTGKLRGFWMRVVGGRKIRAFEGIPYAEPPIGYFRFSEPSPKIPWPGLIWANKKGPKCLQFSQIELKRIVGSEDCLCLNVYTPRVQRHPLNKEGQPAKFPVIIFVHGGGFQIGSGIDYGPSYILQQDIILVTFNYRLGVFGFLSTGDKSSPGNFGLKDQALAIQWVYENIAAFDGDPLRITLMGQEAGGASVHLQMLSLRARPFFQAGVSMSGTAFNPWVFCSKQAAKDLTKYFAKKLNCPVHSSEAIVSCLRRVDATQLAKTQIKFLDDLPIPIYLFRPVLEEVDQKEPPFITESPEEIYRKNLVARIPWIAGFTEDEGLTFLLPSVFRGSIKQLRSNWNHLAPDFLDYNNLKIDQEDVTKKINWLYFKQNTPHSATIKTFSDALSLRFTVAGVHKSLQAHCTIAPTYAYMFSYNGKYNLATLAGIKPQEWGVGQGEDVFYLLNSTHLYQGFKKSDHEMILAKIMVNLFGNFAAKRFPTFTLENGEDFQLWNAITDPRNMSFLLIHKKIKMIPEPYLKQSVYWESIGLPDTTPYINSSEHYRDYHYITSTPGPPPPPPPRIYYSVANPEVFDLRTNLSHYNNLPSDDTDPSPQNVEDFKREADVEHSDPNSRHNVEDSINSFNFLDKNYQTTQSTTTTSQPILRAKENIILTPTTVPTTSTSTTTAETLTTTVQEDSDENSVFLPPWNPFGHEIHHTIPTTTSTTPPTTTTTTTTSTTTLPTTTTTTSTTTTTTPTTTTLETTITSPPEIEEIEIYDPAVEALSPPPTDPTTTEKPLEEEFKHFEIELNDMRQDFFPTFPNSFNLLEDFTPTTSTTTTPPSPTTEDSITSEEYSPETINDPKTETEEEFEKIEIDFKQEPFDIEDDPTSTTTITSTTTTTEAPIIITKSPHNFPGYDDDVDLSSKYKRPNRMPEYITFPFLTKQISDDKPYTIMK